jgi:hypothetical protein
MEVRGAIKHLTTEAVPERFNPKQLQKKKKLY